VLGAGAPNAGNVAGGADVSHGVALDQDQVSAKPGLDGAAIAQAEMVRG
jgi:hypothetical protein